MKISGFLKYDNSSKKKISLIAIMPKYSRGLNKHKKIDNMCMIEPKISEHYRRKANKLLHNSVFGNLLDINFSSLYSSSTGSYPLNRIKKISESISSGNKFSKQDTIKQKKLSRIYKTIMIKSDITEIPMYRYTR